MPKAGFFPNGQSRRGNISEFNSSVTDPTFEELDESCTIGEMYERQKVKILRLYLATAKTAHANTDNTEQPSTSQGSMPSLKKPKRSTRKKLKLNTKPISPKAELVEDAGTPDSPDSEVVFLQNIPESLPLDALESPKVSSQNVPLSSIASTRYFTRSL